MAENNEDWQFYVIPDLRTWAFPREYDKQSEIEHYNSFDEAKERFEELLSEAYNSEDAIGYDGQPSSRLTLGVEKGFAAFDILHVRAGENVLVEDFTRDEDYATDNSLLAAIRKTAAEIGFDKVNSYPILEDGKRGKPSLIPFEQWVAEHPQYNLSGDLTLEQSVSKSVSFYDKPLEYARANGELDKWRDSLHETRRCAETIQKLIAENHDGSHFHFDNVVESAVAEFGTERVSLALAATIQQRDLDGRFSRENKEWANSIDVPQDGYHNEINVNSHSVLLDAVVKYYRENLLSLVKNLAEKQDISDSAEKSAEYFQGGTTMADHETTFEVSSMLKIDDGTRTKAVANVLINGEIAVNNVKVVEGNEGLIIGMPSKKVGDKFEDIVHTTTKEAYAQLKEAVMSNYDKLIASGEKQLKNDLGYDKTKPAVSNIKAAFSEVKHDTVKANGQIKIDDCFVINDVKIMKPKDPEKPLFVSMPSYANKRGGYSEHALPVTTAMYAKINEVGINAYKNMEKVEYKGVKYAELGEKSEIKSTPKMHPEFADKLMAELDNAGIKYQARIGSNTGVTISVNAADKPKLDEIHQTLFKELNPEKEKQQTEAAPAEEKKQSAPEAEKKQTAPKQKHNKH